MLRAIDHHPVLDAEHRASIGETVCGHAAKGGRRLLKDGPLLHHLPHERGVIVRTRGIARLRLVTSGKSEGGCDRENVFHATGYDTKVVSCQGGVLSQA